MIPTLNAVTAGGGLPLEKFVTLASRYGLRGAEFSINEAQALGAPAARAIFDSHNVVPAAFGLPVEWRKDDEQFEAGLIELPLLARTAREMGVDRCATWVLPDSGEPVERYAARSKERLARAAKLLDEQGIRLGLEFIGPHHLRPRADHIWFYDIAGGLQAAEEIEQMAGTQNVGLLVDCWHWYTSGGTVMDLASIPVEKIVHVHINDAPDIPVEEQVDNVRLLPGQTGVIDIRGFLSTLSALGYNGPVAVEVFSEELKGITSDEAAVRTAAATRKVFADAEVEF
jgi:sugar phosphate isomerase/epimerase